MIKIKELAKRILKDAGYRITKYRPANRFDAMQDSMVHLKNAGFDPQIVIDGGSNVGQWAQMAMREFPRAHFHLIEPLPNCLSYLERIVESTGKATLHQTVISRYGISSVDMTFLGEDGMSTGAQVAIQDEAEKWESSSFPATDLDTLFSTLLTTQDRGFLKLDLQGHEIPALEGAKKVLPKIEVILSEIQLFPINDNKRPVFEELLLFLRQYGFIFYDIACLHARRRDNRAMCGDAIFVRSDSSLLADNSWK